MRPVNCFLLLFLLLPAYGSFAQNGKKVKADSLGIVQEILRFQEELNREYKDPKESPLATEDREHFVGHTFFPVAVKYHVKADFVRTKKEKPFEMKTSTIRVREYVKYGEAHFRLDGKKRKLNIYQSVDLVKKPGFEDFLFLPFTDATNGGESYGGGRYLDLKIPAGKTIIIDFNKAYNPYCAYSKKYSCPVPPPENRLDLEIKAGVKNPHE
jgi:uncharacterized protein (DUF1684 family)